VPGLCLTGGKKWREEGKIVCPLVVFGWVGGRQTNDPRDKSAGCPASSHHENGPDD